MCQLGWAKEVAACLLGLLLDIVLQHNISDQWLWWHDVGGGYFVKDVYHLLTTTDPPSEDATLDLIWHKQVPLV
jgi:hypothetical protein